MQRTRQGRLLTFGNFIMHLPSMTKKIDKRLDEELHFKWKGGSLWAIFANRKVLLNNLVKRVASSLYRQAKAIVEQGETQMFLLIILAWRTKKLTKTTPPSSPTTLLKERKPPSSNITIHLSLERRSCSTNKPLALLRASRPTERRSKKSRRKKRLAILEHT